jgi:hypothetical protein
VPASKRAASAIAANPQKSNRAIAKEIGVGANTVRRARGAPLGAPATRVGLDGKSYAVKPKVTLVKVGPVYAEPIQADVRLDTSEERWQRSLDSFARDAIVMRTFWDREFGDWRKFKAASDQVALVAEAAKAWNELAAELGS